jgi:putative transcription factor
MSSCELCGKEDELINAVIEGSMVSVCENCSKFGRTIPIKKPNTYYENRPDKKIRIRQSETVETIVDNYAQLIKQARESSNLKQKIVAKMVGIKESHLHKIESSHIKPSIQLAKKFQAIFKIKLIEIYKEAEQTREINLSKTTLTIGDLIKK